MLFLRLYLLQSLLAYLDGNEHQATQKLMRVQYIIWLYNLDSCFQIVLSSDITNNISISREAPHCNITDSTSYSCCVVGGGPVWASVSGPREDDRADGSGFL